MYPCGKAVPAKGWPGVSGKVWGNAHSMEADTEVEAWGRIMSGTVRMGQTVKVLGEGYSLQVSVAGVS